MRIPLVYAIFAVHYPFIEMLVRRMHHPIASHLGSSPDTASVDRFSVSSAMSTRPTVRE